MNEWYNGGICGDCACIPVCMIYSATGGVAQCRYMISAERYVKRVRAEAHQVVMTMKCGRCGAYVLEQDHLCPQCGAQMKMEVENEE